MKNRRKILYATIIVTFLAVTVFGMRHFEIGIFSAKSVSKSPDPEFIDYSQPTDEQAKAGTTIKEQVADKSITPGSVSNKIDITSISKNSEILMIRTIIRQVTSTGNCALHMSGPNNASFRANVAVQSMASSSTCQGFNVPISGLTEGSWTIEIMFLNGQESAVAVKEVFI